MTNRLGNVPHEIEPANGEEHLARVLARVSDRISPKYRAGQAEHGGKLWRKPALRHMLEEVDDLIVYAEVVERQNRDLVQLLGTAISERSFGLVAQAYNLLTIGNVDGEAEEERG